MVSILVHLQDYEIKTLTSAIYESKEERKDQESIQSSTKPDPGHHIRK